MPVKETECPFCGNPVLVERSWQGKELDCPFCHQVFTLPRENQEHPEISALWAVPVAPETEPEPGDLAYIEPATPFTALKKCVQFRGRSSRREYWLFTMLYAVILLILKIFAVIFFPDSDWIFQIIKFVTAACVLLPQISLSVRRFHDLGRSGLWVLLMFVPCLGVLFFLIAMSLPSQLPDNKYGVNPNGFHPDKAWPVITGWLVVISTALIV